MVGRTHDRGQRNRDHRRSGGGPEVRDYWPRGYQVHPPAPDHERGGNGGSGGGVWGGDTFVKKDGQPIIL